MLKVKCDFIEFLGFPRGNISINVTLELSSSSIDRLLFYSTIYKDSFSCTTSKSIRFTPSRIGVRLSNSVGATEDTGNGSF